MTTFYTINDVMTYLNNYDDNFNYNDDEPSSHYIRKINNEREKIQEAISKLVSFKESEIEPYYTLEYKNAFKNIYKILTREESDILPIENAEPKRGDYWGSERKLFDNLSNTITGAYLELKKEYFDQLLTIYTKFANKVNKIKKTGGRKKLLRRHTTKKNKRTTSKKAFLYKRRSRSKR